MSDDIMCVKQVAGRLGVSVYTVYALMRAGELRYISAGIKKGYRVPGWAVLEFERRRLSAEHDLINE